MTTFRYTLRLSFLICILMLLLILISSSKILSSTLERLIFFQNEMLGCNSSNIIPVVYGLGGIISFCIGSVSSLNIVREAVLKRPLSRKFDPKLAVCGVVIFLAPFSALIALSCKVPDRVGGTPVMHFIGNIAIYISPIAFTAAGVFIFSSFAAFLLAK